VKYVRMMLGRASAARTLDVYTDLFDDDVDAVADARPSSLSRCGQMWSQAERGLVRGTTLKS